MSTENLFSEAESWVGKAGKPETSGRSSRSLPPMIFLYSVGHGRGLVSADHACSFAELAGFFCDNPASPASKNTVNASEEMALILRVSRGNSGHGALPDVVQIAIGWGG